MIGETKERPLTVHRPRAGQALADGDGGPHLAAGPAARRRRARAARRRAGRRAGAARRAARAAAARRRAGRLRAGAGRRRRPRYRRAAPGPADASFVPRGVGNDLCRFQRKWSRWRTSCARWASAGRTRASGRWRSWRACARWSSCSPTPPRSGSSRFVRIERRRYCESRLRSIR